MRNTSLNFNIYLEIYFTLNMNTQLLTKCKKGKKGRKEVTVFEKKTSFNYVMQSVANVTLRSLLLSILMVTRVTVTQKLKIMFKKIMNTPSNRRGRKC